jgi:hypothetical protein
LAVAAAAATTTATEMLILSNKPMDQGQHAVPFLVIL